jgi:hypothetical protein
VLDLKTKIAHNIVVRNISTQQGSLMYASGKTPKVTRITALILGIILGLVVAAYIGINLIIGLSVRSESNRALLKFGGDRVEALIAEVDCETCALHNRNQAVWALGQLRDKRALPVLHKYFTGGPCNHNREICQDELRKALQWTEGNSLMAPRLWRPFL